MSIDVWLAALGLQRYAPAFRDNDIDSDVLPDLTAEDLESLGVASVGHRRRLLAAAAGLRAGRHTGIGEAAAIGSANQAHAVAAEPHGAERRQLTVMFIDLVGSTALSGRLDPEDMHGLVLAYQNAVAGDVTRYEGHVAKFMGDGVLAYFGWPRAHEDEAERAVRAALAIRKTIAASTAPDGQRLQTRIGIATGIVVVGDLVGEGMAQERSAVGDTINLAARLQAIADPDAIVIAPGTYAIVGDGFVVQDLGAQALKGIAEPTAAFAVLRERTVASRFAARRSGDHSPIVARNEELSILLEHWRQAAGGEGQVVLLSGEAGIGKSRITEALVDSLADHPSGLVRYQCSPYHGDSPLHPAIQQIAAELGLAEIEGLDRKLDRLQVLCEAADDGAEQAASLLAALLGLDGSSRYGEVVLDPQQRRTRTLTHIVEQVVGRAKTQPVLWIIEDAHWIDPTTLELLEYALDKIAASRVLILITSRPTFVATFASHPIVTRLALNRLGRQAIRAIVANLAGGKRLPEALLDEIAAKTDGVPLFVEEITKAVIESGLLREDADAYHLDGPLSGLAIPTTLHDSLMARLDRLQPVKEVAQIASVIGRSFDHRTIEALADRVGRDVGDAMRQLVDAELVFRRGQPPDASYLFKHALVRDAAYESLLRSRRQDLHGRLLRLFETRGDASPEIMAQHAEAAGNANSAIDYWEQAGRRALTRPAYKEAIADLKNALRLCDVPSPSPSLERERRILSITLCLGQALIASRGYQAEETLQLFREAADLAVKVGDLSEQLPATFGLWAGHHIAGTGSGDLGRQFAMLAQSQPDLGPQIVGLRVLGLELFYEGRFREALSPTQESLDRYEPQRHRDLAHRFGHDPRAASANYKAWILWHMGHLEEAARTIDENLTWTREIGHANTTGLVLCMGTMTNIWLRRPLQVEAAAREAIKLAEQMGLALWHAWGQVHLGWALSYAEAARGIDAMAAGLDEARRIGAGRYEPFHLSLLAEAYARVGRHVEARERMVRAFEGLAMGHHAAFAADLYRIRASVSRSAGQDGSTGAMEDLRVALDIAARQQAPALALRAARDLARLLAEQGQGQEAVQLLAPAYAAFQGGPDMADVGEAKTLLDALQH